MAKRINITKGIYGISWSRVIQGSVLATSLIAIVFIGDCSPQGQRFGPTGKAAVIAGSVVSSSAFRDALMQRRRQEAEASPQLAQQVMDQLVSEQAFDAALDEAGFLAQDLEVKEMIKKDPTFFGKDGKFSAEVFQNYERGYKRNGYTQKEFVHRYRRMISRAQFQSFISDTMHVAEPTMELSYKLRETKIEADYVALDLQKIKVDVSQSELDEFMADEKNAEKLKQRYESRRTTYEKPKKIKARHILVSYGGARNASEDVANVSKEAAKDRAKALYEKVAAAGADFAKIASAETDEASGRSNGGDLGWFQKETMVKEFSDVAFAMVPGTVSEPVESPFGYHIIKVESVEEAKNVSFDEAKKELAQETIATDRKRSVFDEQAAKLQAALKKGGTASESVLKELGLAWESTGPITGESRFIPGVGYGQEPVLALLQLTKEDPVSEVVDVSGKKVVFRLKSKVVPDLKNFDDEMRDNLKFREKNMQARSLIMAFQTNSRKQLEEDGEIWVNEDFVKFNWVPKS